MFPLLLALTAGAPPAPGEVPFVVEGVGDERSAGKLVRLTTDFTATLAGKSVETTVKDAISLRRLGRPVPAFPTGPQLVTANGDRIAGELLGGGGQSLRFAPSAAAPKEGDCWLVPLSSALAVWLTDTPADTPPDPTRYPWVEGGKNRDVLRFRNGDTARGTVVGLGPEAAVPALQFRPETGDARAVGRKELAAVVFNPTLAKARRPKGPYARVVLADGSRLDLVNPTVADDVLKGEALFGQKVELPLAAVVALDVFQGKAVYLSDLKPKKAEQSGFLGVAWPWAADRKVNGTPLKLLAVGGESTFDKGLGTHPKTVLTYDLGGKFRRFEAVVGLDPDAGVRGEAKARVLVDGKPHPVEQFGGRPLIAGLPAVVRIDVTGVKELVLEVDFGGVGAGVVWGDARVVE